jgi:hypothetical protein
MGLNMVTDGPETARGHHGEDPMEMTAMMPPGPSPTSPPAAQEMYLENHANGMDALGLAQKLYPGYSPEVPPHAASMAMLGTPMSPMQDLAALSNDPLSLLRILKDCHVQQQGSFPEGMPGPPVNPVIKQESQQMAPTEAQITEAQLPQPGRDTTCFSTGSVQHPWGVPDLNQHPQMRVLPQPPRAWCARPMAGGAPQWAMEAPMQGIVSGPPTSQGLGLQTRDLGMPLPSAPAALRIQITLPHGVEGAMSQAGSPATRPSTPSGVWRIDHSGRGTVLRTESLPVDFRVGAKFEGASN